MKLRFPFPAAPSLGGLLLSAVVVAAPAGAAQLCSPAVDGDVAKASYGDTTISWDPLVEHDEMVLTVGGPCEDVVKVFRRGDPISFDLREITRLTDGAYTWELRRVPTVDPSVQEALAESRKTGDESIWWELFERGLIPAGPYVESETFEVVDGRIVPPDQGEEKAAVGEKPAWLAAAPEHGFTPGKAIEGTVTEKGVVLTNADGIIRNSLCVGFDCPTNPSFSDTTILLMENNTRIKFDDTSTLAGFPANDWEIQANGNNSGNYFAVNDCASSSQGACAEDPLFKVEAGARANSLYVESDGDVGLGTANPVLDLHLVTGNTPGLRLEQDGSSGFTAQSWDVAGNEVNFFVRDVTGGSTLPFRIRPGAPSSSIDVSADGDVGVGTASPAATLEVQDSVVSPTQPLLLLDNPTGPPRLEQRNGAGPHTWRQTVTGSGEFNIDDTLDGIIEASFAQNGNLTISGNVITTNCPVGCGPDFVFAPDYELMSLDELGAFVAENKHLPNVPPAKEMETNGINMTQLQLRMLEKIEELTLYTLGQHQTIRDQGELIEELRGRLAALEAVATPR